MDQDVEMLYIDEEPIVVEEVEERLDTNIESDVESIDINEPEVLTDQMYEGLLGTMTVNVDVNHSQYLPNQHTIGAITGLTETLDEIQSLKDTIYTKNTNVANYYLWLDENPLQEDRKGYFVCLGTNNKISICGNSDEIFGVTVDGAGFVGNQDDIARDSKYALVVCSGAVNVRCENSVIQGDYVVTNVRGMAEANTLDYGYKVSAISNINGIRYATISLSSWEQQVVDLGDDVDSLKTRMNNAEVNIASAISVANTAYHTAEGTMDAIRIATEAQTYATEALGTVEDLEEEITDAVTTSEQALTIANATSAVAANIRSEAVSTANQALASALSAVGTANTLQITVDNHTATLSSLSNWQTETNTSVAQLQQIVGPDGARLQGLVANIDKYRIGDYSQANGLTFAQAIDILDVGSVYIPTVLHTEVYGGSPNVTMSFSRGFYYTWSNTGWVESASTMVNFSHVYITGNYNSPYWYVDSGSDVVNGNNIYTAHSLYEWKNGAWEKVVTFNSLGRSVGLLQAEADSILAEVTGARGTAASLNARITNEEAQTSIIASMVTDNSSINIANTVTNISSLPHGVSSGTYYAVGASAPYDVYKFSGSTWNKIAYLSYDGVNVKELNAASIVNSVNDSGSSININADKINFTGFTTFLKPSDVGSSGSTTIDGARITTGTINTNRLSASGIIASINNEGSTTINGGKITTNTITASQLATDAITSTNYLYVSGVVQYTSDLPNNSATGTYYSVRAQSNKIYRYNGSSWVQTSYTYTGAAAGVYSGTQLDLSNGVFRSKNFNIDANGNVTANNMNLTGGTIQSSNYVADTSGTSINLTTGQFDSKNFKIAANGNVTAKDLTVTGNATINGYLTVESGSNLELNCTTIEFGSSGISFGSEGNSNFDSYGNLTANNAIFNDATLNDLIATGTITVKTGNTTMATITSASAGAFTAYNNGVYAAQIGGAGGGNLSIGAGAFTATTNNGVVTLTLNGSSITSWPNDASNAVFG